MLALGTIWNVSIAVTAGLLLAWIALIIVLLVRRPDGSNSNDALRILPDTVRLVRRIASDPAVPTGVRVRLFVLLIYLASPIDLIPDFVPVIGYADDAVIVAIVLRSVVHRAGSDAVRRHWPGTDEGLANLSRIAGLRSSGPARGDGRMDT